jgi:hypothetical protein
VHIRIAPQGQLVGSRIPLRCPHCGQNGTFDAVPKILDLKVPQHWLGLRKCPNPKCDGQLFIIANDRFDIEKSYPALRIDFDAAGIPERIKETLIEAITCHAEACYAASAIMVRRCLEEICEDRKAAGGDLNARIAALRANVVLPNELFDAMDELRILGNDAAHVEAKVYDDIGEPQVSIALELTKEILKAIYQLDTLVKKMQALKGKPERSGT